MLDICNRTALLISYVRICAFRNRFHKSLCPLHLSILHLRITSLFLRLRLRAVRCKVAVALNLSGSRLIKFCFSDIDTFDCLIRRHFFVGFVDQFLVKMIDIAAAHLAKTLFQKRVIRENIGGNHHIADFVVFSAIHQRFLYQFIFHEHSFHFLREDILAAFGNDDGLLSAGQVEETVLIKISQVASVKPAVFQHLVGSFLIVVIPNHDGVTLADHFTDSVFVGVLNANLCAGHRFSD